VLAFTILGRVALASVLSLQWKDAADHLVLYAGVALSQAGLDLASRSGSEAATVMSARACAIFRKGLAQALEHTNARLLSVGVQIRRFQVLREKFTTQNGLLRPDLSLDRVAITTRYRHLIDDMFQHQADYPSKWIPGLPDAPLDSGREGNQSHSPERSVRGAMEQAGTGAAHHEAAQAAPFSANNPYHQCASYPREERYANYAREPSPRSFTREASPRQFTPRKCQPLPKSVRMLNMDGNSLKSPTPRDRGRSLACIFCTHKFAMLSPVYFAAPCPYDSGNLPPQ